MNEVHSEKLEKARSLASDLISMPLANSEISTIEYAGETIKELCDYCDRLRAEYEKRHHTIRIELRDGTVIRGHVITDDAARVLRVFRDCADVVAADCEPA